MHSLPFKAAAPPLAVAAAQLASRANSVPEAIKRARGSSDTVIDTSCAEDTISDCSCALAMSSLVVLFIAVCEGRSLSSSSQPLGRSSSEITFPSYTLRTFQVTVTRSFVHDGALAGRPVPCHAAEARRTGGTSINGRSCNRASCVLEFAAFLAPRLGGILSNKVQKCADACRTHTHL